MEERERASLRALLEEKVSKMSIQQGDREGWRRERESVTQSCAGTGEQDECSAGRQRRMEGGEGVTQSCVGTEGEQGQC